MAFYGIPGLAEPYLGWAVYAVLIFFLGTSHPPPSEELSNLGKSRVGIGIVTGLILVFTFIPSPLVFGESQFDLDIDLELTEFNPVFGESNITNLVILNSGEADGWDNLTINLENIDNYTIELVVNFVNISDSSKSYNSSNYNFTKYVSWDSTGHNLTLNLTSNSYANLTLIITPEEVPLPGVIDFDIKITSRTERVYTRTFVLVTEEEI